MKKILCMCFMLLMVCASCFAKGGADVLSREEFLADTVFVGIFSKSANYDSVAFNFTDESRKVFTPEKFAETRKFLESEFGSVSDIKLLSYNRRMDVNGNYIGVDDAAFLASSSKGGKLVLILSFVDVNGIAKIDALHIGKAGVQPVGQSK